LVAVAVTAPSDPNMIIQPLASATRSLGNQVDDGFESGHQRAGNAKSNHGARNKKLREARRGYQTAWRRQPQ